MNFRKTIRERFPAVDLPVMPWHVLSGASSSLPTVDRRVTLKDGDQRAFWDNELMWPYYKAWLRRKDKEDQKPKTQILAAMCGHVSEVPIGA